MPSKWSCLCDNFWVNACPWRWLWQTCLQSVCWSGGWVHSFLGEDVHKRDTSAKIADQDVWNHVPCIWLIYLLTNVYDPPEQHLKRHIIITELLEIMIDGCHYYNHQCYTHIYTRIMYAWYMIENHSSSIKVKWFNWSWLLHSYNRTKVRSG